MNLLLLFYSFYNRAVYLLNEFRTKLFKHTSLSPPFDKIMRFEPCSMARIYSKSLNYNGKQENIYIKYFQ